MKEKYLFDTVSNECQKYPRICSPKYIYEYEI